MIATWYVMEDGSVSDPSEVGRDAAGVLRHRDGRAVALRGGALPRTRSVDVGEQAGAPVAASTDAKDMAPAKPKRTYRTREAKAD